MKDLLDNFGVLVVDMQPGFEEYIDNKKELITAHKTLLKFAQERDIPIYFLEYYDEEETLPEIKNFNKDYKKQKSFEKRYNNGFLTRQGYPDLSQLLQEDRVRNLMISGINKNVCVKETAEGAKERGYVLYNAEELMNQRGRYNDWYNLHSHHFQSCQELIEFLKK